MKREQAIELLALRMLDSLSEEERTEQLEVMALEDWSESMGWNQLPKAVRDEFEAGELNSHPNSEKYNDVLLVWLKSELLPVANDFLKESLGVVSIEGKPIQLHSCPCCGCRTIGERGMYDICRVCWWEDDGQDNKSADKVYSGPNYGISLTQARYNFLQFGIYDPERTDLAKLKEPISKYVRGREFEIVGEHIIEKETNWKGIITTFTDQSTN